MAVLVSPVLVGRRAELDQLVAAYGRAADGEPVVVLVGGEAGVGKTRLVEQAMLQSAEKGARVLAGGCVELGGEGLPLAPLVDALRALARSSSPEELDELLGPARAELAQLLPELDPGARSPTGGSRDSARLFEYVLGVVARLAAQQPLVLVVEDLQWADRATLDLVVFLVRALRAVPVLVVATYRSDDLHRGHPLRPVLASLERVRAVQRLELRPFSRDEVADQVESILGEPPDARLVDGVFERSEGNAFLVEEMLGIVRSGAGLDELPPSLRDVLLARAEQLSQPAQRILRTAAVAGRRVPDRLLTAVADMPEGALEDAVREAVEHHVLVVDEGAYRFRHALVRDAVYDDMLPTEQARLHTAYGEAVERDPALAGDAGDAAAALAHHWYAAHDLPRALPAAIQAARHANDSFAPADAERHLDRALAMWPQVTGAEERTGLDRTALTDLAIDSALRAGRSDRALALVDEALASIDRERDRLRAAILLNSRFEALRYRGQVEARADLQEAERLLPADPPTRELAIVLAALANSRLWLREFPAAAEEATRALAAARAVGDRQQEVRALLTLGTALAYERDPEAGLAALREARTLAEEIDDDFSMLRAVTNISDVLALVGRDEEAIAEATAGLELSRQIGWSRRIGGFFAFNAAESLLRVGRWTEAERYAREALDLDEAEAPARGLLAEIATGTGRLEDAVHHMERARADRVKVPDAAHAVELDLREAEVAHATRDWDTARTIVARSVASAPPVERLVWPLVSLGLRVEADAAALARDLREPRDPAAGTRVGELARRAAGLRTDTPGDVLHSALADAEQARIAGDPAVGPWEQAAEAARSAKVPFSLAYALLRLAEGHLASGDRAAAGEAVREAAAIARDLEAAPLLADLEALARGGRLEGAGPQAAAAQPRSAAERLGRTGREQEVLRLLAEGQTNAQIAGELFISPKTASVHVSHILAKLGVSRRAEAAAVAHRSGLAE